MWALLGHATETRPGPRFASDVIRAARLLRAPVPWWKRLLIPAPLAGFAGAAAAITLVFHALRPAVLPVPATESAAEEIAEIADDEALAAAAEHLDAFTDNELAALVGL